MPSFPNLPSFDFSKLDLSKLDLSKLDLSKFDLSKIPTPDLSKLRDLNVAGVDGEKVLGILRDAVYVAIGFGVLTVQQIQVRRRELADRLGSSPVVKQLGLTKDQLDEIVKSVEARVAAAETRLEAVESKIDARIEALLGQIEPHLPETAGNVLGQAHDLAKATRKQLRGLVRNAA